MKRIAWIATLALTLFISLFSGYVPTLKAASEAPQVQWNRTYGPQSVSSVVQTEDGGYALVGQYGIEYISLHYGSYWNATALLMKLDENGNVQWNKTYSDLVGDGLAVSVSQTKDLGYIIFGLSGGNYWLIKTDSQGNAEWNRTYLLNHYLVSLGGILTRDGGYFIFGSGSPGDSWPTVSYLYKMDGRGNELWNKTIGNNSSGVWVNSAIETKEGYAVVGSWGINFWFAKLNTEGKILLNQSYNFAQQPPQWHTSFSAFSIAPTSNSGYIATGGQYLDFGYPTVYWMFELDSVGNSKWKYSYAGQQTDVSPYGAILGAFQIADRGYVAAGTIGGYPVLLYEQHKAWLFKTDSLGKTLWNISYGSISAVTSFMITRDGGCLIAGNTEDTSYRGVEIWLAKFAPISLEPNVPSGILSFPITWVVIGIIVTLAIVGLALLIYFRKCK